MTTTSQIAKHLREIYFGGNWTSVNIRETVADVTWQQATTKIYSLNTIAALLYHIHYYIVSVSTVLQNNPLDSKDSESFNHPPIESAGDWDDFCHQRWREVELFASLVAQLDDEILPETFVDEKYGSYHRNLLGIIEHAHYHLGQIVLIKKILSQH